MKTLDISNSTTNSRSIADITGTIQKHIERLDQEKRALVNMLKACGFPSIDEETQNYTTQTKIRKSVRHRKSARRGAPNELFEEVIQKMNGDFTVDQLLSTVRREKLDFDRTQIMNAIHSLIKHGKVKVVHSGKGRAIAIYAKANNNHNKKSE